MKKRYFVLGASVVLAIALAVPALGGPTNPVATTAAGVKGTAKKALKKAKKANRNAKGAQATADEALSAANNAQNAANGAQATADGAQAAATAAQATADQALQEAQNPTGTKLGLQRVSDSTPNDSSDPKSALAVCPTNKALTGGWGFISAVDDISFQGTLPFYEASFSLAFEDPATASNWQLTAVGACINE